MVGVAGNGSLDVWLSADGVSWVRATLPASQGFMPTAITPWQSGFAVAAVAQDTAPVPASSEVWLSSDGKAWQPPTQLPGFGAQTLRALDGRLVALGARPDTTGWPPSSLSSTDGVTWNESPLPSSLPYPAIEQAGVVGDCLVAIASTNQPMPASTLGPGETWPPLQNAAAWLSCDGTSWTPVPMDLKLNRGQVVDLIGIGGGW
jgi:hypothetical protein